MKRHNNQQTRKEQLSETAKKERRVRRKQKLAKMIARRTKHWTNHIGYLKRTLIETQRELTALTVKHEELLKKLPQEGPTNVPAAPTES